MTEYSLIINVISPFNDFSCSALLQLIESEAAASCSKVSNTIVGDKVALRGSVLAVRMVGGRDLKHCSIHTQKHWGPYVYVGK